jgi:uncharacterized membrane protein YraQ (UPF0718 family)
MKIIRNVFVGLLIAVLMNPYIPEISFAQVGSEEDEISRHIPEFRFSAEEDIPIGKIETAGATWAWVILGVLVVGGIVALAAGSGGGGGSSNGSGGSSNNSSVTVGW